MEKIDELRASVAALEKLVARGKVVNVKLKTAAIEAVIRIGKQQIKALEEV